MPDGMDDKNMLVNHDGLQPSLLSKTFIKAALFTTFLGLALFLGLRSHGAAQAQSSESPPNIIFVIFDALRADHVSAYGYLRQTTPTVDDRLAGKGVLFSEATALTSWTKPSNASMLASMLPTELFADWTKSNAPVLDRQMMLAEYLREAGYNTAGFIDSWFMRAQFGFAQGFDTYEIVGVDGDSINHLAMTWLDENGYQSGNSSDPLFLFLYYYDPHSEYVPPPPFDTMFDPDYTGPITGEIFGHGREVVSGDLILSERDREHVIALYDGDIAYSDSLLDSMLDDLEQRGLLENSLIVFSSDHGEMFGEHDKWIHRNSLYEEVLRVPLIFRYEGVLPEGAVMDVPVDHLDVTPTILDLAGIPMSSQISGRSLAPLMIGEETALPERPIYAMLAGETDPEGDAYWIAPRVNLYSIKQDGYKLIHQQQSDPASNELYMVEEQSIFEEENVAAGDPERAAVMWDELQQYFSIPTKFLFLPLVERP
jgi:arylsulfatase A-like enzyme